MHHNQVRASLKLGERALVGHIREESFLRHAAYNVLTHFALANGTILQVIEFKWRRVPESNRCTRICNPLRNHSANSPEPVLLKFTERSRQAVITHVISTRSVYVLARFSAAERARIS